MDYKCYRNINKKIIVPYIKVGLTDFLYLIILVFSGFVMFYILGMFSMAIAVSFLLVFVFSVIGLIFWLRRQYHKDGSLDILVEYIDFILENSIIKGRDR